MHFQGDTSPYLVPATGQPSFHLLKMVRPELVVDLRTAIYKARRERCHRRCGDAVQFELQGQPAAVRLEVRPLKKRNGKKSQSAGRVSENRSRLRPDGSEKPDAKKHSCRKTRRDARTRVASTREHLRVLIAEHEAAQEEMKAANEEVLSSNEELQSTNEELETAKEELQSSNEELITLNDELQHQQCGAERSDARSD